MLSFMREQDGENKPQGKSTPKLKNAFLFKGGKKDTKTITDDNPAQDNQGYLTTDASKKSVRKSTMLLIVFFTISLLCLLFMIKKSPVQAQAEQSSITEDAQIESAITRLTGVKTQMFNAIEKIVKKFYEFSDVRQVEVNELAKNPFEYEIFLAGLNKTTDTNRNNSKSQNRRILMQMLNQQAKNMRLLSIMQSDAGNCCMIDDKILYEGDSIKGCYVSEIGDGFVVLEQRLNPNQDSPTNNENNTAKNAQYSGAQIILKLSE